MLGRIMRVMNVMMMMMMMMMITASVGDDYTRR